MLTVLIYYLSLVCQVSTCLHPLFIVSIIIKSTKFPSGGGDKYDGEKENKRSNYKTNSGDKHVDRSDRGDRGDRGDVGGENGEEKGGSKGGSAVAITELDRERQREKEEEQERYRRNWLGKD